MGRDEDSNTLVEVVRLSGAVRLVRSGGGLRDVPILH